MHARARARKPTVRRTYFQRSLRLQRTERLTASFISVSFHFCGWGRFCFKNVIILFFGRCYGIWTSTRAIFSRCAHTYWYWRCTQGWTQSRRRRAHLWLSQNCRLPGKSCNEVSGLVAMSVVSNDMGITADEVMLWALYRCFRCCISKKITD